MPSDPELVTATSVARTIHQLSSRLWGEGRETLLIGQHASWLAILDRLVRFGSADAPVLLSGESGTGKEALARTLFLLARTHRKTFSVVNCAQYLNDQMMASELFGHQKGSFTGATSDHTGVLEAADGGTVCLDEVGELSLAAQAMLLRAVGEHEILPVGATRPKWIDVRIIASTNRNLREMVTRGTFRADLFFRLRQLEVRVPPLRERGNDWELIAEHHLSRLGSRHSAFKSLSAESMTSLASYAWPGNVRELKAAIETGFHLSHGPEILYRDVCEALEGTSNVAEFSRIPYSTEGVGWSAEECCDTLSSGGESFWDHVVPQFMEREINRAQFQQLISRGLGSANGSYKQVVDLFRLPESDYPRFMDFLRHHRLKPQREGRASFT